MSGGLKEIVARLEYQHGAINRALAALRGVEITGSPVAAAPVRRRGMSPEGKKRLIAALKRRWAEKRKAARSL